MAAPRRKELHHHVPLPVHHEIERILRQRNLRFNRGSRLDHRVRRDLHVLELRQHVLHGAELRVLLGILVDGLDGALDSFPLLDDKIRPVFRHIFHDFVVPESGGVALLRLQHLLHHALVVRQRALRRIVETNRGNLVHEGVRQHVQHVVAPVFLVQSARGAEERPCP